MNIALFQFPDLLLHQVSGSEHEIEGSDKVRALLEQRTGRGKCRKRKRRKGRAEHGRQGDLLEARFSHAGRQFRLGDKGLYHGTDAITENEGPAGLPEKAQRRFGGRAVECPK